MSSCIAYVARVIDKDRFVPGLFEVISTSNDKPNILCPKIGARGHMWWLKHEYPSTTFVYEPNLLIDLTTGESRPTPG
jgi:hypothetical protein